MDIRFPTKTRKVEIYDFNTSNCGKLRRYLCWLLNWLNLIWKPALGYYLVILAFGLIYNFALDKSKQAVFNNVADYFSKYASDLPVITVVGFFTSSCVGQLCSAMQKFPVPNSVIRTFTQSLKKDAHERSERIELYARYVYLLWLLTFRRISPALRREFPSLLDMETRGFILYNERLLLQKYEALPDGNDTLSPLVYTLIVKLLEDTSEKGLLSDSGALLRNIGVINTLVENGNSVDRALFENSSLILMARVVTFAVYWFGILSTLGHTLADNNYNTSFLNSYFFIPYASRFVFFYSWLTVGRMALRPFGNEQVLREDCDLIRTLKKQIDAYIRDQEFSDKPLSDFFPNPFT